MKTGASKGGWHAGMVQPPAVKRIATLGDSITFGIYASDYGGFQEYASPLILPHRFVGTYVRTLLQQGQGAAGVMPPQWHDGVSGNTLSDMQARVAAMMTLLNPDVVVLLGGINDLNNGVGVGAVVSSHAALRSAILAYSSVKLVVVSLTPITVDTVVGGQPVNDAVVISVNSSISAAVAAERSAGSKVAFCDVHTPMIAVTNWQTLLIDDPTKLHPLDAGFALIGPIIATAINAILAV